MRKQGQNKRKQKKRHLAVTLATTTFQQIKKPPKKGG
jgi:hypothetical protein